MRTGKNIKERVRNPYPDTGRGMLMYQTPGRLEGSEEKFGKNDDFSKSDLSSSTHFQSELWLSNKEIILRG